ncbi:MAG: patatin-like phospholipase family protein [Deltaproteobacteria bacterium]|nr:patatin-like phospholipase family protein [Deltaproteobacteria bacterium]
MQYDLAFEGGGAKGAVFAGALAELEARGHTARRIVGTSAGAITATLTAAGYSASELRDVLAEKLPDGRPRLTTFMDVPRRFEAAELRGSLIARALEKIDIPLLPERTEKRLDERILEQMMEYGLLRQLFSLLEHGGLFEGAEFVTWIREKLDRKRPGWADATLLEFSAQSGSDVSLIASDTTGQEMLVLNRRTAPHCPVAWAVRMSMSIPFVWQEIEWRPSWGLYRGRDLSGHVIVDGGVLSNFPIQLLTANLAEVVEVMGDADPAAVPNVGFLIDENLRVEDAPQPGCEAEPDAGLLDDLLRSSPAQRVRRLLDTMMHAHDRMVIERCMANQEICRLPAGGYRTSEFDMSEPRLEALVQAGRRATKAYFDRRERRERRRASSSPPAAR